MALGGLAVSLGIICFGVGLFVLAYPELLVDSSIGAGARPDGMTVRRWAQLRAALVAAVGVALMTVGFGSMLYL